MRTWPDGVADTSDDAWVGVLTRRQREILSLVGQGLTAREIARRLGISPKTVEQHKSRIFAKLGVPNQAAAVRLAASRSGVRRHVDPPGMLR